MPHCICQTHLSWYGKGHNSECPCHPDNRPKPPLKPGMHLEFLLRDKDGKKTEIAVRLPCGYAWQEGPEDLHIQFNGPGSDNFWPIMKGGDYLIPDPKGPGIVHAYHLAFKGEKVRWPRRPQTGVGTYQQRIEALWPSPNRD